MFRKKKSEQDDGTAQVGKKIGLGGQKPAKGKPKKLTKEKSVKNRSDRKLSAAQKLEKPTPIGVKPVRMSGSLSINKIKNPIITYSEPSNSAVFKLILDNITDSDIPPMISCNACIQPKDITYLDGLVRDMDAAVPADYVENIAPKQAVVDDNDVKLTIL